MTELDRILELAGVNRTPRSIMTEIKEVGITDVGELPLTDDEINNASEVSMVLNLPLYRVDKGIDSIFFVTCENRVIAWTYGPIFPITRDGDMAFMARRSKVDYEHRGKGLMTNIYNTINKRLKMSVVSDDSQSSDAKRMWRQIYNNNKNRVHKYNYDTGEVQPLDDFDSVYGDQDWGLLLEMSSNMKKIYESTTAFHPPTDIICYPCDVYKGQP